MVTFAGVGLAHVGTEVAANVVRGTKEEPGTKAGAIIGCLKVRLSEWMGGKNDPLGWASADLSRMRVWVIKQRTMWCHSNLIGNRNRSRKARYCNRSVDEIEIGVICY